MQENKHPWRKSFNKNTKRVKARTYQNDFIKKIQRKEAFIESEIQTDLISTIYRKR